MFQICHKVFKCKAYLIPHIRTHFGVGRKKSSKKQNCLLCQTVFKSNEKLQQHINEKHPTLFQSDCIKVEQLEEQVEWFTQVEGGKTFVYINARNCTLQPDTNHEEFYRNTKVKFHRYSVIFRKGGNRRKLSFCIHEVVWHCLHFCVWNRYDNCVPKIEEDMPQLNKA